MHTNAIRLAQFFNFIILYEVRSDINWIAVDLVNVNDPLMTISSKVSVSSTFYAVYRSNDVEEKGKGAEKKRGKKER